MTLIDITSCETPLAKRQQQLNRTDRLGVFLVFVGAIIFHLAVIFDLLPSA